MAENNLITKAQMAKVRELDYAQKFGENVENLIKMLGITRKIAVTAGTVLKVKKVTGTLASGIVGEGETIPLSQYETTWTPVAEATLLKWRKSASAEAILKGGYDQAINDTDNKMILDIQKGIRTQFVNFLATGTGTAGGNGLQAGLADAWGKLAVKFEDDAIKAVYLVNPQDVADYLATANITVQTAFGLNYVENFLGLGTVIMTGAIPKGTFYATAADNIVLYYVNASEGNGLGGAFDFTTDKETGYIGLHEESKYDNLTAQTVAVCGLTLFAEMPDGVFVGSFNSAPLADITVSVLPSSATVYGVDVSDIQNGVTLTGKKFAGTLKYLEGDNAIVNEWGAGNFLAITFDAAQLTGNYDKVMVGLEPTQGSGAVDLMQNLSDLDSVFKIGNDVSQKFKIVSSKAGKPDNVQVFDLSDLILEADAEG